MIKTLPDNIIMKDVPVQLQHVATPGTYKANVQIGKDRVQQNICIKINDEKDAPYLQIYFAVNCSPMVCFLPLVNFSWLKEEIAIENIMRVEAQPFQQILIASFLPNRKLYAMG